MPNDWKYEVAYGDPKNKVVATYRGFTSFTPAAAAEPGVWRVAVVDFDGEPELWILQNEAAVKELRRMYMDDYGRCGDILLLRVAGGVAAVKHFARAVPPPAV